MDPRSGLGGIGCLWLWLTGFECPGCGLSRALAWLVRGQLGSALAANWLIAPLAIVSAQHAVVAVTRDRRSRRELLNGRTRRC